MPDTTCAEAESGALWKTDWPQARLALTDWWAGKGPALHVTAPKETPWEDRPVPAPPRDLEQQWLDPDWRVQSQLYRLANTYFGGVAFPHFDTNIGPGSLGLFLGCEGRLAPDTVWYGPCMSEPDRHSPLRFDPANRWYRLHTDLIDAALEHAKGRYIAGMPDLIENLDTYAQLRDPQATLFDLVERPDQVIRRIGEINDAFFECFEALERKVRTPWGGNSWVAFDIWGPGRTAKVQCDACCMISPAMFRRVVQPALTAQCDWLDYAMFHLDGTNAIPQLDNLLSIDSLKVIEWTPQAGRPGGGSPEWYDLYRRIKAGGKSVQAVGVAYDEVLPLLDAVGPEGMFVMTWAATEAAARELLERCG